MRTTENHQDKTDSKLYNVLTTYTLRIEINNISKNQIDVVCLKHFIKNDLLNYIHNSIENTEDTRKRANLQGASQVLKQNAPEISELAFV
jgi:stalled ribosome rescue protein Dom34